MLKFYCTFYEALTLSSPKLKYGLIVSSNWSVNPIIGNVVDKC